MLLCLYAPSGRPRIADTGTCACALRFVGSAGGYRVLPHKRIEYEVPDLTGFTVR